jgi:four helix bundle protein
MNRVELEERLIDFSVKIIDISNQLKSSDSATVLKNQVIRSGTSTALNFGEASGAESDKDFIHKYQIVLKELRETYIALRIIKKANLAKDDHILERILDENNQLISIFVTSIKTFKGV